MAVYCDQYNTWTSTMFRIWWPSETTIITSLLHHKWRRVARQFMIGNKHRLIRQAIQMTSNYYMSTYLVEVFKTFRMAYSLYCLSVCLVLRDSKTIILMQMAVSFFWKWRKNIIKINSLGQKYNLIEYSDNLTYKLSMLCVLCQEYLLMLLSLFCCV